MNLCKNCEHFSARQGMDYTRGLCLCESNISTRWTDPVLGEEHIEYRNSSALQCRQLSVENACGPEAKWFVQRPEPATFREQLPPLDGLELDL